MPEASVISTDGALKHRWLVVWAVATKDIVDALRNKTTLSVVISVGFLMLTTQILPLLFRLSDVTQVAVYDAGGSRWAEALSLAGDVQVLRVTSQAELERLLGESARPRLGVIIPAGFDQALEAGAAPELQGYYVHWMGEGEAARLRDLLEGRLTDLAGTPVTIRIWDNLIYPEADAIGRPLMTALALVVGILTISGILVPHLFLEEKETKTLDALLVSPASIGQVVAGKAIAGMVYGLAAAAVVFAFDRAVVVHWDWSILTALAATFFAVALGLLIGVLFENPQNMSLGMGLAFLLLLLPVVLDVVALELPEPLDSVAAWTPGAVMNRLFRFSFAESVPPDRMLAYVAWTVAWGVGLLVAVVGTVRRTDLR
jgi:ABC-2 type transport system permease protein